MVMRTTRSANQRGTHQRALRARNIARPMHISADFTGAFTRSAAEAQRLTSELLTANRPSRDRFADAGELVNWVSVSGNMTQRRAMIAGFIKSGAEVALIHQMAKLPRAQTAVFMKDYFSQGGKLGPIVLWLSMLGNVIRAARAGNLARAKMPARLLARRVKGARALRTPKWLQDLGDFAEDAWEDTKDAVGKAVDVVVDTVGSVVDSVVKAGKSIASAIGEAVNWTLDEVTDLVDALLDAGKQVADVLAAAATKGVEQLKKYVQAVADAGRGIGETLVWAATQVSAVFNPVIAKLVEMGRSVLDIVKSVITMTRTAVGNIIKGLIAAGKTLGNLMVALANETITVMKPFIDALLAAGQTLKNVLIEAAKLAATACKVVLQAMLDLGKALVDLLREVATAVGDTLKVIAQNLLALGKTLTQILVAAAELAATAVKAVISALIALGKKAADMVVAIANQAMAIMKAVFTAMLAAGIKLVEILVGLCGRTLSAIRTAMEAMVAMKISLALLVGNICTGVLAEFRRGFFEGLIALGKAPLELIKAAAEYRVSCALLAFSVILEMFGGYKPLHQVPGALEEAKRLFGTSIKLERVQVGFADLPGDVIRYVNAELPRAFTTMYLLNFGPGAKLDMRTIIHELAHVWQGAQTGPLYMTRALEAQMGAGLKELLQHGKYDDDEAYEVSTTDLTNNGGDLSKFNPEQQAVIVEEFWMGRFSGDMVAKNAIPANLTGGPAELPVEALLPYVQKVNPKLRLGAAKTATRRMAARGPRVASAKPVYRRPAGGIAVAYA